MTMIISDRIEEWRSQLLDTTKRNRLINLKLGKTGALKLIHPTAELVWEQLVALGGTMSFPSQQELVGESDEDPSGRYPSVFDPETDGDTSAGRIDIKRCLESPRLLESHLLTDLSDKLLKSRLGRLALNAKTSITEQGVPTLFLTFGLMRWFESADSQVGILSPLLLFPAELERESIGSPWQLRVQEDEVVPNHSLVRLMSGNFAIKIPEPPDTEELEPAECRDRYFEGVRNAIRHQKKWGILDDCCLGIFSFQKIAMWEDLGRNQDQIAAHDLCRAIAGDGSVRHKAPEGLPRERDLDKATQPNRTFHILDSDSSQHVAIEAAKRGANLIVEGPPGTGKSQTIANIIAEFLSEGKSVLFVSEKSAALEVVKRRLDENGLGDFCLECHSHKANKKQVINELGRCLNLPSETYKDQEDDLAHLFDTRETLNAYVRSLHEVRQPLGISAYQVHGRLVAIPTGVVSRCPVPDLEQINADRLRKLTDLLKALPDFRNVTENYTVHPWRGSKAQGRSLSLDEEIRHHFGRLELAFVEMVQAAPLLARLGFLSHEPTLEDWLQGLELSRESPSYPLVPPEWFQEEPRKIAARYIRLDRSTREYRQARQRMPEFGEEAVLGIEQAETLSFPAAIDERCSNLLPHGNETLITLRDHLRSVVDSLALLSIHARSTDGALARLLGILMLKPRPIPARRLSEVRELLEIVGRFDRLLRSWLDPLQRDEVRRSLDLCRHDLPEFREPKVFELAAGDVAQFESALEVSTTILKPHGTTTLRAFLDRLERAILSVRTMDRHFAVNQESLRNVLTVLHSPVRPIAMRGLRKVHELLDLIGNIRAIRRFWLNPQARQEVRRILELCRTTLPEFSESKAIGIGLAEVQGYSSLLDTSSTILLPHGKTSVVALRDHLDRVLFSLRNLADNFTATEECLGKVLTSLGEAKRHLLVRGLGSVIELLSRLLSVGRLHRSWLDPRQRKEISRVLDRCRDEETVIADVRFKLLERLLPMAFSPEGAILASRSRSYRAGWKRLLPGWWSLRGKLASYYGGRLPETLVLIEDMVQLEDYHRRMDYVRQLINQYADRIVLRENGELDRDRTLEGLSLAEQFDPLIREIPNLKEVLINPSGIDRDPLRTELDQLTRQHRQFEESVASSGDHIKLGLDFSPEGRLSTAEFAGWLQAESPKLEALSTSAGRLVSLLKTGRDVPLADLASRIDALKTIIQANLRPPSDYFLLDESGELDLRGTIEGIRAAELLDPLIRAFPELKDVLVDPARIDRFALEGPLERLKQSYRAYQESATAAGEFVDLSAVFSPDGRLSKVSATDFVAWLGSELSKLETKAATFGRLVALLKPDRDVELSNLPARFAKLNRIIGSNLRPAPKYLMLDEAGEFDFQTTIQGLKTAEQLDPFVRFFPESISVLVDPGTIDRDAFGKSRDQLTQGLESLSEALTRVESHFRLSEVFHEDGSLSTMTPSDFAGWIDAESAKLEARFTSLNQLALLLKPGRDVPVVHLSDRLASIQSLRRSRSEITTIAGLLGLSSMDFATIQEHDWGESRSKAEWTIGFLAEYGDAPPEPLIRAATVPEIRGELDEAVRRNLAIKSDSFLKSWKFLTDLFDPEQEVSTGIRIGRAPIGVLSTWVGERAKDAGLIREWIDFGELRQRIVQAGLGPILAELSDRKLDVKDACDAFLARFYRSWLDWFYGQDASLQRFSVEDHERAIQRFRSLDKDSVRLAFTRIRARLLSDGARPNVNSLDTPSTSELGILLREMNKKRRHLGLRHLFARIPTVLTRLKPCLMMSPLAVSTYLETKDILFDVVIFDEASQVRPYDAISAIYRGKQLVVAGDQNQLPPTSFFERSVADEDLSSDEQEATEELKDFESILDVCGTLGLARRRLRWHYRSKREPLIAFSNRHIYKGELVTFPSVLDTGATPAVRFEFVEAGRWKSGTSGGFNVVEAKRIAEIIMEHFRQNPLQSLGVIAFSQRQQTAILDELEQLRRLQPEMEKFFKEDDEEPFFVKNLENVQGDERDVIFLSVGYGPDEKDGRVAMRFGPLNLLGGERRLNVAVSRSRSAMLVISSLKSHDIDLSRTKAVGVKLLRDYLDFAERGISALVSEITQVNEHDYDSPFEKEVADALTRRGFAVKSQIGCSGFRIDLALVDPKRPSRFLLGIECDGATYRGSATARDRDRLRQEVLESLGWTIVRIWSTDWVKNPNSQIDQVVAALEQAQKAPRKSVVSQSRSSAKVQCGDEIPVKITPVVKRSEQSEHQYTFDKIEDVPESTIEKLVLSILGSYGATGEDEVKQTTCRQLGFGRMGKNINARIELTIESLIRATKVVRLDGGSLKLRGAIPK